MKRKLNSILFGLLLLVSIVGCGSDDNKQKNSSSRSIGIQAEINPDTKLKKYVPTGNLTPNGGETWYLDQNETIHWDNTMIFGNDASLYVLHEENNLTLDDLNLSTLLSTMNWYMFEQNASNYISTYHLNPRDLNFIGKTRLLVVSNQSGDWDISDNSFTVSDSNDTNSSSINIDNTYIESNLSNPQIVELFGLEFKATKAVASIEDDNGRLKITGYNRAKNDDNVESIDINLSAKEFNATIGFIPEANLNTYWANSIELKLGISSENNYQDATMMISEDGIQMWLDDKRYDEFNMTDFNISLPHTYALNLEDNKTIFVIDNLEVFEANLSDSNFTLLNRSIRFTGKGIAYIENVSYANLMTPPLNQNDLDFINRVRGDLNQSKSRLDSIIIATDLNQSIYTIIDNIEILLENNPLQYELIDEKLQELWDYESIAFYVTELNEIRYYINNTANLSQDLNNTLQSLINNIESHFILPLNREVIDSKFNQLREIDFSFITEKEQEINEILNAITSHSNFSNETNSSIYILIGDIQALLEVTPINYNQINAKIEELRSIESELSSRDVSESEDNNLTNSNASHSYNIHGDNASIIQGKVSLSDTDLDSTENSIYIDLFDSENEFLGSGKVQADGNYTLYFKELNATTSIIVKLYTTINGIEESFYRDFGTDHIISDDDSFKSEQGLSWNENNSTGKWTPNINHLNIETQVTTLNLNLDEKDSNTYTLNGTVRVPADFILGAITDTEGNEQGWNMVSLTAINTTTGEHYWTELGKTQTDVVNTYPFNIKLPNINANYIIRIEKVSNNNGASEWIEMYLDDESSTNTPNSDHSFNGNETLISGIGVEWKENENNTWIPDTNKTGYFSVNSNVDNITIDITTYGINFKKIEGTINPPEDFILSESQNNIYIEMIDAQTGYWLGNTVVNNDNSYSILLGDTVNSHGYILKVTLDHWNQENWENSYSKSFYLDFTNDTDYELKDESEVRWIESTNDTTQSYWTPNVQPLIITNTTTLNIDFNSYQVPITYSVSGTLLGLPTSAKWVNVYLYDPNSYVGKSTEVNNDGSFTIKDFKAGRYIINIGYSDENEGYRYYDYLLVDNNGDFTSGTTLKESTEVKWVPFTTNGTVIPQSNIDVVGFDWDTVAYWAPEETTSQKTLMTLTSDIELGDIIIPQPIPPSNLLVSLSGVEANKVVDFNLFVKNEPIGRWESNTSSSNGTISINISNLKARDDYQLQIWIDGIEYWYNGTDALTYEYDGSGFTILQGATKELLNLTVPNEKRTISAILALGSDYSNKNIDVYLWQNISPYNHTWESFIANDNGDVNITLSVKEGTNYIMETYNPEIGNGFTIDLGTGTQTSGDETLILTQNSWEIDNTGMWNPKTSVLLDMTNDLYLGRLNPPNLKTVTFTLFGLALENGSISEDVWISLEDPVTQTWYGSGNADWSDGTNPTFSNTLSIKVPDTTSSYYIYMYAMDHESGLIDENGNDTITVIDASPDTAKIDLSTGSARVTWDSTNADTITLSNDTNISLILKSTDDYKSILGLVTLGNGDIEAGWICADSPTNGNCGEVNADGTYIINGLSPINDEEFNIQYWANSGATFNTSEAWEDSSSDLTVNMDITAVTLININGTVKDSDVSTVPVEIVLLDVNGTDWKVLDTQVLVLQTNDEEINFVFTNLSEARAGHHYEVAVASSVMNQTTGATTYSIQNATQIGSETPSNITNNDATITLNLTNN